MKILGIDTTTKLLCLGLYVDGKTYGYSLETGRKLSSLLVPCIKNVLEAAALKVSDIDYFACGLGPGAFTGIRIGMATIKGLSVTGPKAVIGVPTMDILAENVEAEEALIIPAIDARRGLVYSSSYRKEKGELKRKSGYKLLSPEEFISTISRRAVVFGDGADLYKKKICSDCGSVTFLDKDYWFPKPHNLIKLALRGIKTGQVFSAEEIKPIYIYPQECQVKKR